MTSTPSSSHLPRWSFLSTLWPGPHAIAPSLTPSTKMFSELFDLELKMVSGLKKIPHIIEKSQLQHAGRGDVSYVKDVVRCMLVVQRMDQVAVVVEQLLRCEAIVVVRIKERFVEVPSAGGGETSWCHFTLATTPSGGISVSFRWYTRLCWRRAKDCPGTWCTDELEIRWSGITGQTLDGVPLTAPAKTVNGFNADWSRTSALEMDNLGQPHYLNREQCEAALAVGSS